MVGDEPFAEKYSPGLAASSPEPRFRVASKREYCSLLWNFHSYFSIPLRNSYKYLLCYRPRGMTIIAIIVPFSTLHIRSMIEPPTSPPIFSPYITIPIKPYISSVSISCSFSLPFDSTLFLPSRLESPTPYIHRPQT